MRMKKKPASETAAPAQGQLPWKLKFAGGRYRPLVAAVVAMLIVVVCVDVEPKLMVLLGLKVTTGKSTAPDGVEVNIAVKAAVPLKPFAAFIVTVLIVEEPCVTGAGFVAATVTPPMAMLRLVDVADWLLASVALTVNVEVAPIAEAAGVPDITPVPAKLSPAGRLPEAIDQV